MPAANKLTTTLYHVIVETGYQSGIQLGWYLDRLTAIQFVDQLAEALDLLDGHGIIVTDIDSIFVSHKGQTVYTAHL